MLRRIAVHLDQGVNSTSRFDLALNLAREFKAELQGIYTAYMPSGYEPAYVYGDYFLTAEMLEDLRKTSQADRDKTEAHVIAAAAQQGIKAGWFSAEQAPAEELAAHARLSDLLILGQEDKEDTRATSGGFSEYVVFSVGRPVLVTPPGYRQETVGQRILLCWDGSREAARALADAAPFLQVAEELMILAVQEDKGVIRRSLAPPPDELKVYCQAHSYDISKYIHRTRAQQSIGDVILSVAAEEKVDLVVMGAYGHSRLREWVLGGATHSLLKASPVPVLLSH